MIVKFTKNLTKQSAYSVKYQYSDKFYEFKTDIRIYGRKNNMRKLLYVFVLLILSLTVFAACEAADGVDQDPQTFSEETQLTGQQDSTASATENDIVTTYEPEPAYIPDTDGNGVYIIKDARDMEWLSDLVNNNNSEVGEDFEARLENDIDMSGVSEWNPIGADSATMFRGIFDGAGHTVSGFNIDRSDKDYIALFGVLYNGTIKDLKLENSCISGAKFTAGICASNSGIITGCRTAAEISGSDTVGGICAVNNGIVQNCSNDGTVSADANIAGGICGYSLAGSTLFCVNRGEIRCDQFAGGIVGYDENGTISSCDNYGGVTAKSFAGGICGRTESQNIYTYSGGQLVYEENDGSGIIYECTNHGFVSAELLYAAGINSYSCYYIEHCSNMGVISAPEATYVAGISACADKGAVYACTNYSSVSGGSAAAGIVGSARVPIVMCENLENITVYADNAYCGGICADETDIIAHCLNAGTFPPDRDAGAVCCITSSNVISCADVGSADAADGEYVGVPVVLRIDDGGAVLGCFSTGNTRDGVFELSDEAVASGELAYLLQSSLVSGEYLWGQRLDSDLNPEITKSNNLRVYRVTEYTSCDFENADKLTAYSNTDADIIPEHSYEDGICTVCGIRES